MDNERVGLMYIMAIVAVVAIVSIMYLAYTPKGIMNNQIGLAAAPLREVKVVDEVPLYDYGGFTVTSSGVTTPATSPTISGKCGDVNNDLIINLVDVSYLINYLYRGGPAPIPMSAGDVNNNGKIDLLDTSYLIDYLYRGGPAPICLNTTNTCFDSDGGLNFNVSGYVNQTYTNGSSFHISDYCVGSTVYEYYCSGTNVVIPPQSANCANGCSNGACLPATICTNDCTPSGVEQCSGSGYVTCGNYDSDSCLEWSSVYFCPYGCTNGVCNNPPQNNTCFDSDGGFNPNMFGFVNGTIVNGTNVTYYNYVDYCSGSNVYERYCSGTSPQVGSYICYGCTNGACTLPPQKPDLVILSAAYVGKIWNGTYNVTRINTTIKNIGNATMNLTWLEVNVVIVNNSTGNRSSNGYKFIALPVNSIIDIQTDIYPAVTTGAYTYHGTVDPRNVISESNEYNNYYTTTLVIT